MVILKSDFDLVINKTSIYNISTGIMKNAIVKLGLCLFFFCAAYTAFATGPIPTVTRKSSTNPTRGTSVIFQIDFDVNVTGFGDDPSTDFLLSGAAGTAAGVSATLTNTVNAKKYEVTVTGLTVSGTVGLDIKAGAANASVGGAASEVSTGSQTFTFDGNPEPNVTHSGSSPSVNTDILLFIVDFQEDVTDFDGSQIKFTGSGASMTNLSVDHINNLTPNQKWEVYIQVDVATALAGEDVVVSVTPGTVHDTYGNGNNDNDNSTITYGGVAPTVSNTSITSTETTFTIQGDVTFNGGDNTVKRGSVWKQGSPASATDNKVQSGTGSGSFSQLRNDGSIQSGKLYYVTAYADNGNGGVILATPQLQVYTLSAIPGSNSNITSIDVISATALDVNFDKFQGFSNTQGIVILRSESPTTLSNADIVDGKAPTTANMPTIVGIITSNTQTKFSDPADALPGTPALQGGHTYYYAAVPFNWNTTNTETYNYKSGFTPASATTKSATSQIKLNSAPATLAYINRTTSSPLTGLGDGMVIADFTLYDGDGTTNDPDALPTKIQTLTIHVDNANMVNRIAVYDNGTIHDEGVLDASGNITFNIGAGDLESGDNNTGGGSPDQFNIIASFNTANVDEGAIIKVTITGATLYSGSSDLINAAAGGANTGSQNAIEVTATDYTYSGNPSAIDANVSFGVVVTAVDANNKVDKNLTGNIVLSEATMTPPSASVALSSGVATFTNSLQFADAGSKTIAVNSSTTGPMGKSFGITVNSLGIVPTYPNAAASTMCPNSASTNADPASWYNFGPIVIAESDKTDFGVGANQTFALMLPTNFIFDVTTNPTLTSSATADISATITPLSYIGNNILRFQYSISAQATKDIITINNLKIKYIGTDSVKNADILRVGGTAIQKKNDDGLNSHGKLFALYKITGVSPGIDFKNTNGGSIKPNETRFPKASSTPIVLQGFLTSGPTDVPGVFTGDGVALDSDGKYKFYPNSVSLGSHPITFTYTEASGCKTAITKTFEVFSSSITGLALQYCDNSPASTLTGQSAFPSTYLCSDGITQQYTFDYYVYYDPSFGWKPLGGSTTTGNDVFDPAAAIYQSVYQSTANIYGFYGLFIGYQVQDHCFGGSFTWTYDVVRVERKPTASITTSMKFVCSNGTPITLKGNPNVTSGSTFDKFWVSDVGAPGDPDHPTLTGVVGNSTIGFSFDPSVGLNGATGSKTMQLNYQYQASNGCSDQTSIVFTEFEQPAVVSGNLITIDATAGDLAAEFCETEKIGETTASNPGGVFYNWYSNAMVRLTTDNDKFDPNKSLDPDADGKPNVGILTFKVTQTTNRQGSTFLGCESDPLSFTIEVIKAPVVTLTNNTVNVCNGQDVTLADLAGVITPNTLGGNWSTLTSTSAAFKNSTGTTGVTSLQLSRTYTPVQADKDNKGVIITLTSDIPPDGVCAATSNSILVNVNGSLSVLPMTQTVICGTDPGVPSPTTVTLTGVVQNNSVNDANAALHWTTSNGLGPIINGDNQTMQYVPTQSELDAGALIQFKAQTDDPDGGGPCASDFKNTTIKINKRAIIEAGNPFSSCSDVTIPLNGQIVTGSAPVSVTWSGGAGIITNANQAVASYQPDATEQTGQTQIIFTLTSTDPDGAEPCPIVTDNLLVNLYPKPAVPDILGYAPTDIPNYKYCVNDVLTDLSAIGIEVTWYADAALTNIRGTGNTFPPAAGGASTTAANNYSFWVTQTTNKLPGALPNGCRSDGRELQITVNPLPVPSFTAANFCLTDLTEFTDASTVPGSRTITDWSWDFADGLTALEFGGKDVPVPPGSQGGSTTGTYNNPIHVFANIGVYDVKLTVRSSDGCVQTANAKSLPFFNNKEIRIGAKPQADFSFVKICDGDETKFTYTGTIPEQIPTYDWDFDDGSSNGTDVSPLHEFPGVGEYHVTLTATTDLGCSDVITRRTNIVPYVKTFPYIENFESSNHGWFAEGVVFDGSSSTSETSWNLMTAAGDIGSGVVGTNPSTAAGSTFWVTHTNVDVNKFYFDNERSALYGPCVDMTALTRPVIALDYFNDTEPQSDGAYVEYKIEDANGGGTWERLGDNVQGLEWYNGASIGGLSSLGGIGQAVSQYGWTGSSIPEGTTNITGWKTGRYNLDQRAGDTRLRFRIVFGSNTSLVNPDTYDGFAVDYFKLESRNRLVLVENFTSASGSTAVTNNTSSFKAFPSAASSAEVVKIEYHTGLPAVAGDQQDPIFKQNPMDPSGRASFYGLSAVPRGYIDGYSNLDASGSFYASTEGDLISVWAKNYYGTESLKTSPIAIVIDKPTITNGVMNIKGRITATETELLANRYSLYVAVVEKTVGADAYVLRKMLPSASGVKVPATPQGGSFEFDESWSIEQASLGTSPELIAVAFVQSDVMNANKERPVLQAAFNDELGPGDINYTTGLEKPFLEQTALYPNPADKIATIELPHATKFGVEVSVIDQLGRPVVKSAIGIGQRSTSINTGDLSGAVYIIQLKENGVLTTRKLLVTHSDR